MSDNYTEQVRSFEVLAKAAFRASAAVQGMETESIRAFLGSYLFGRIAAHSVAIIKLCPESDLATGLIQLFDIPSTATLARALIDTFYSFYYHSAEPVDNAERDFRLKLALLNGDTQHLRMLRSLGAELTDEDAVDSETLREELVSSPVFQSLTPEFQRILRKGKRARHLDFSQLNKRLGIDRGYFRATWDYLSSESHALSHSVIEGIGRRSHPEPSPREERLSLILHHTSLFLSLSLSQFCDIFQSAAKQISEEASCIIRELRCGKVAFLSEI